ncbi:hypothetical protein [Paraburkholderia sp. GAS348]|uniref:hypothetical protein n=1 Tax=Paraburkholderia sp. GAS348 TaxID=3035132 RepID=UPI003D1D1274
MENDLVARRPNDAIVRIGVDVVVHFDVLKPPLSKRDASDGAAGANTKKQMSLDLDDLLWRLRERVSSTDTQERPYEEAEVRTEEGG